MYQRYVLDDAIGVVAFFFRHRDSRLIIASFLFFSIRNLAVRILEVTLSRLILPTSSSLAVGRLQEWKGLSTNAWMQRRSDSGQR
jgi:hypothetical protein